MAMSRQDSRGDGLAPAWYQVRSAGLTLVKLLFVACVIPAPSFA